MRGCGQGHSGLKKFSTLINMPPLITLKNYDKLAVTIKTAVKKVAMESTVDSRYNELNSVSLVFL